MYIKQKTKNPELDIGNFSGNFRKILFELRYMTRIIKGKAGNNLVRHEFWYFLFVSLVLDKGIHVSS